VSRVLIVANETVGASELLAEIRRLEDEKTSTYRVVVPARPLHEVHGATWTQEGAQDAARVRLEATLAILREEGLDADGAVGDYLPLNAIRDALMDFDADLIVISTHPEERSRWMRKGVVEMARKKFGKPIIHIVSHVPAEAAAGQG
jgi:GABA permease